MVGTAGLRVLVCVRVDCDDFGILAAGVADVLVEKNMCDPHTHAARIEHEREQDWAAVLIRFLPVTGDAADTLSE
jgi:hypothetical protein